MEPTTQPTTSLPPTYTEILKAMGEQLKARKGALVKRVLLITWPALLFVVAAYLFNQMGGLDRYTGLDNGTFMAAIVVYIFLAGIYMTIIQFIFAIEKRIWVDSYFDKKNLSLQESWKISLKLFWPAFVFRLKIWAQYYLLPFFVVLIVIAILGSVIVYSGSRSGEWAYGWIAVFLAIIIGIIVYGYYIRTYLRYSWFVFLDTFGTGNSHAMILSEMRKLNTISKSETFKKSLLVNLGTDAVNDIVRNVVTIIGSSIAHIGGQAGQMVGGIIRIYGEEMTRQVTELSNIAGQYILYRFARKEAFGEEQHVNENIYKIN